MLLRSLKLRRLPLHVLPPPLTRKVTVLPTLAMRLSKPLDFAAGPLVWIDCEMTGLNPQTDQILEIAVRLVMYMR